VFFEGDSKQEARWKMIESVERKTLAGSCSSRSVNRALEATLRCGADLFRLLFPGAGGFGGDMGSQAGAAIRKTWTRCRSRADSEQRAHASAIIAGESAIAESAGPAAVSARLAGGDIVALAGSVNIHLLFRHAAEH
jgi:hypothetical protein